MVDFSSISSHTLRHRFNTPWPWLGCARMQLLSLGISGKIPEDSDFEFPAMSFLGCIDSWLRMMNVVVLFATPTFCGLRTAPWSPKLSDLLDQSGPHHSNRKEDKLFKVDMVMRIFRGSVLKEMPFNLYFLFTTHIPMNLLRHGVMLHQVWVAKPVTVQWPAFGSWIIKLANRARRSEPREWLRPWPKPRAPERLKTLKWNDSNSLFQPDQQGDSSIYIDLFGPGNYDITSSISKNIQERQHLRDCMDFQ